LTDNSMASLVKAKEMLMQLARLKGVIEEEIKSEEKSEEVSIRKICDHIEICHAQIDVAQREKRKTLEKAAERQKNCKDEEKHRRRDQSQVEINRWFRGENRCRGLK